LAHFDISSDATTFFAMLRFFVTSFCSVDVTFGKIFSFLLISLSVSFQHRLLIVVYYPYSDWTKTKFASAALMAVTQKISSW
jgi:hypothetical protein